MKLASVLVAWLGKGFGYVLLSMGVSRPGTKAIPAVAPGRNQDERA